MSKICSLPSESFLSTERSRNTHTHTHLHTHMHIILIYIYNTKEVDTCPMEGQGINREGRVLQEQDEDSNRWKVGHVPSRQQRKEIMKVYGLCG